MQENRSLAIRIRALANAIEATREPDRVAQHLKELKKLAETELRLRKEE
jgi:hypothetical protein